MDKLKTNKTKMQICSLVNEFSAEQPLESSITLPEYFGDIVKVLRCTVCPVAASVTCSSGRITAEGVNVIRVVYAADNGGVYSYETTEQFSKYIDVNSCDDACSVVDTITAEGIACRAVNQRRIEIRATVRFRYSVYRNLDIEMLSSADGSGIQTRNRSFTNNNIQNITAKKITVSENYELPGGKTAIKRVISISADAVVSDVKAINNKVMLKGDINQKVLYVTDTENETLETVKFTIPFSEIVDVNGISDETENTINIKVINSEAAMKPMQNGSMRTLECTVNMQTVISCGKVSEVSAVTDAFSTEYESQIKTVGVSSAVYSQHIAESFITDGSFELADITPESIADYDCKINSVKTSLNNEKINVTGTVVFGLMINTAAGTLSFIERNLDFNFTKEIGDIAGDPVFTPSLSVYASSAVLNGHKANVKTEIFIDGNLSVVQNISAVSDIVLDEQNPKKKSESGMIIYFADENENIWDIAKKYDTSPSVIAKDNKLSSEVVAEKQTLLISCI